MRRYHYKSQEKVESMEPQDEDKKRLMKDHLIDDDTAEKAQELIDEGLDEDEAVELADEL